MTVFISSLIRGIKHVKEVADWVDGLKDSQVGVELIAFTHDCAYWEQLEEILAGLHCPVSFHGPYIGTEGTSAPGTPEQEHLLNSYQLVFALAKKHGIRHVVYHTTQKGFLPDEVDEKRKLADDNVTRIVAMGAEQGVTVLVENLPYPVASELVPLYSNTQYTDFFDRYPQTQSIIDIGHAHMNHLDLESFLARHGTRVQAYHFHNNNGVLDQHKDIFDGTFSFSDFALLYRKHTPDAAIILEYEPHVTLSWEEMRARIDYLQNRYGTVKYFSQISLQSAENGINSP